MLHWGWFVLLLQTLGLGLDTNGLINITAPCVSVPATCNIRPGRLLLYRGKPHYVHHCLENAAYTQFVAHADH